MRILIVIVIFIQMLAHQVTAQDAATKRKTSFNIEDGVAINGYDPVSYFDGKPLEGTKSFQYTHQGVTYRFANQANMDKFKANPSKYEPAYGGWCAYAMGAKGEKVEVNPETYKITNGRLYLFYNAFFNNTLKDWNKDEKGLMKKADDNWKKLN